MAPSEAEAARFARQLALPGLGEAGLARIRAARVHVVGAGPVAGRRRLSQAGPALLSLAQAGVGTLFLDDGEDVKPGDGRSWLCAADQEGTPRALAAREALRAASALTTVRFHATGVRPGATLVCAESQGTATMAAERARTSGVPCVAVLASDGGGEVISVPLGAPCLRCASRPAAGAQARGGLAAAMGCLGALELLLLLTGLVPRDAGRRVELRDGRFETTATARRQGCDCHVVY
jgi:hypothetical protein